MTSPSLNKGTSPTILGLTQFNKDQVERCWTSTGDFSQTHPVRGVARAPEAAVVTTCSLQPEIPHCSPDTHTHTHTFIFSLSLSLSLSLFLSLSLSEGTCISGLSGFKAQRDQTTCPPSRNQNTSYSQSCATGWLFQLFEVLRQEKTKFKIFCLSNLVKLFQNRK
jgi:hypothetical protein